MSFSMQLRWRCEELLRTELDMVWEAYSEAKKVAISTSHPGPEWHRVEILRDWYMKALGRFSALIIAKSPEDMFRWARVMGWDVVTEEGVIVAVQEMLRKGPGRETGQAKEKMA